MQENDIDLYAQFKEKLDPYTDFIYKSNKTVIYMLHTVQSLQHLVDDTSFSNDTQLSSVVTQLWAITDKWKSLDRDVQVRLGHLRPKT